MTLSVIVAMARNGVIGKDGQLPWHLPPDLRRFKALTMGNTLLMGRKTFDSIGRALPGRTTVVVTRKEELEAPDEVLVASSLEDAIKLAKGDELFVAGGAEIYEQALERAERLYVTRVGADFDGDTYFPAVDWSRWHLIEASSPLPDPEIEFRWAYFTYERR